MTNVYVTALEPIGNELFTLLLESIDSKTRERILRLKRHEDQVRSLVGHALAKMMLAKQLKKSVTELEFIRNQFGKYELAGYPLHFNITHAGQYTVCAIARSMIGVDIEKKEDRDYRLFKSVWSEEEKKQYSLEDCQSFYWLWTAKESYIKYLGVGFQANLEAITVQKDGRVVENGLRSRAVIRHVSVHSHYTCAVCCEEKMDETIYIGLDEIECFYKRKDLDE